MKKFYALMIALFAMLIGATGCGESTSKYGVIHDDNTVFDEDNVTNDDQVDDADVVEITDEPAMEYGPVKTDYDTTDNDVDDIPVTDCEYGVPYADYDIDTTDADTEEVSDEPVVEYGSPAVDYDENPDEITTDYGPISTKFHK